MRCLFLFVVSFSLLACASKPELPKEYVQAKRILDEAPTKPDRKTSQIRAHYARTIASVEIRPIETDCQVYSQPNVYSERLDTAKAGRDVWTQDTGSEWYKVYRGQKFGYMSKICFQN